MLADAGLAGLARPLVGVEEVGQGDVAVEHLLQRTGLGRLWEPEVGELESIRCGSPRRANASAVAVGYARPSLGEWSWVHDALPGGARNARHLCQVNSVRRLVDVPTV